MLGSSACVHFDVWKVALATSKSLRFCMLYFLGRYRKIPALWLVKGWDCGLMKGNVTQNQYVESCTNGVDHLGISCRFSFLNLLIKILYWKILDPIHSLWKDRFFLFIFIVDLSAFSGVLQIRKSTTIIKRLSCKDSGTSDTSCNFVSKYWTQDVLSWRENQSFSDFLRKGNHWN